MIDDLSGTIRGFKVRLQFEKPSDLKPLLAIKDVYVEISQNRYTLAYSNGREALQISEEGYVGDVEVIVPLTVHDFNMVDAKGDLDIHVDFPSDSGFRVSVELDALTCMRSVIDYERPNDRTRLRTDRMQT